MTDAHARIFECSRYTLRDRCFIAILGTLPDPQGLAVSD